MASEKTTVWQDSNRFADGFRILQGEQEYVNYREHSSLRIWSSEEAQRYERHNHSAVEIIWTLKGTVVIETPARTYQVSENQILIIPSECPHTLAMDEESSRILFLFEPVTIMNMRDMSYMVSLWSRIIYLTEDEELCPQVRKLLGTVNEIYNSGQPMWNTLCYSYLMQIYALFAGYYMARSGKPAGATHIDPEIMNSAIDYIKQHYMKKVSLDDVADFVGFSRHYFSRTFKQYTGVPFSLFLTRCRLEEAENRLINSDDSIQTVAFDCGFASIATFNRVFKEQQKCTPTQYRLVYNERVQSENSAGRSGGNARG